MRSASPCDIPIIATQACAAILLPVHARCAAGLFAEVADPLATAAAVCAVRPRPCGGLDCAGH
jgi:hypothetical protein